MIRTGRFMIVGLVSGLVAAAADAELQQIAHSTQVAPGSNSALFGSFEAPVLNEAGVAAFWTSLQFYSGIYYYRDGAVANLANNIRTTIDRPAGDPSLEYRSFFVDLDDADDLSPDPIHSIESDFALNASGDFLVTVKQSYYGYATVILGTLPVTGDDTGGLWPEVSWDFAGDYGGDNPILGLIPQRSRDAGGFFDDSSYSEPDYVGYGEYDFGSGGSGEPVVALRMTYAREGRGETTDPVRVDPFYPDSWYYEHFVGFDTGEFRMNPRGDLLIVASTTAGTSVFLVGDYRGDFLEPDGYARQVWFDEDPALVAQGVSTFSLSDSHVAFLRSDDLYRVDIRDPDGAVLGTSEGLAPDVMVGAVGAMTSTGETIDGFSEWTRVDDHGRVTAAAFLDLFSTIALLRSTPEDAPVGPMHVIVRGGDPTPDGDGTFDLPFPSESGDNVHVNAPGQVLFETAVAGSSRDRGLFITDGIETVQVLRKGDPLGGRTISSFALKSGDDPGGKQAFNDYAQAAFKVGFTDGTEGVYLYTPALTFRGTAGDGQWDSPGNWTLSIAPGPVHDVTIDGAAAVTGPASNTNVRSLTLGNSGAGVGDPGPSLTMQAGKSLALGGGALILHPDATLGFEIGSASSFARLIDVGHATLAGTLSVALLNDHTPQVGDVFDLFDFTGPVTGDFDAFDLPALAGGLIWQTDGLLATGRISVVQFAPGDADGDGDVDGDDFNAWGGSFPTASGATLAQGDFDLDGDVDGDDFNVWGGNFPSPAPAPGRGDAFGGADASAVPEPAALVMLSVLSLAACRRRGR